LLACPGIVTANGNETIIQEITDGHILPRFETLAATAEHLANTADQDCAPDSAALRSAYADAFDAWISASHLRFGPTEVDDRAFALAFWPDSRGATPRTLSALIDARDPIAAKPEAYSQVSIAAGGSMRWNSCCLMKHSAARAMQHITAP